MRQMISFLFSLLFVAVTTTAQAAPIEKTALPPPGPAVSQGAVISALADRDGNGLSDDLQVKVETAHPSTRFDVVVTFNGPENARGLQGAVGPFAVKREFRIIRGFSGTMTAAQIRGLERTPGIFRIEENFKVFGFLDGATEDYGVNTVHDTFGQTGAGTGICIIDTGADVSHVMLQGQDVDFFDAINGLSSPYDDHGHGTHVASIALGLNALTSGGWLQGVAPGASLYIAKGLDSNGEGNDAAIVSAIEWCVGKPDVDILSMSFGTMEGTDGQTALDQAVNCAADPAWSATCGPIGGEPKIPVSAAGNSGPGKETVGSPGAALHAISVAAVGNWTGDEGEYEAGFTSRGPTLGGLPKPDISAPGVRIRAAAAGTGNGLSVKSGTSMATPFTAGVVALLLEADPTLAVSDGTLPVDKIKAILSATAFDRGAPGHDTEYGAGLIDAKAAVAQATGAPILPPTPYPNYHREIGFVADGGEWFSTPFTVMAKDRVTGITATILIDGSPYCYSGAPEACYFLGWGWEFSPDLELELVDASTGAVVTAGPGDITVSTCPLAGEYCGLCAPGFGCVLPGAGRQETVHYTPTSADIGRTFQFRVYSFLGEGSFDFEQRYGPLGDGTVPGNSDPVADDDGANTPEDTAVTVAVLSNDGDPDGDGLDITGVTQGSKGSVAINDNGAGDSTDSVTYTPNTDETGIDSFTYTISDGLGGTDSATVTVTINAVNDPPTADAGPNQTVTDSDNSGSESVNLDGSGSYDPDGDVLSYTWSEDATTFSTNTSDPNPQVSLSVGSHTITLTVSDGVFIDTDTVVITVNDINGAPVADDQGVVTDEDAAVAITLTASDADGDPLSFAVTAGPANGILSGSAPNLTYTPNGGFNGSDSFTFTANDGTVDSNTATVSITVTPAQGGFGTITGTVTNGSNGRALKKASVTADPGGSTQTNPKGKYTLNDVPAGSVTVTVSRDGFVTVQQTISLSDGATATLDVALQPESGGTDPGGTGTIKGTVWGDSGARIKGAAVEAASISATTKKRGTFTLNGVPSGEQTLNVTAPGGACSASPLITVISGSTVTQDVFLPCL